MGWYGCDGKFRNAREFFEREFSTELTNGKIRDFSAGKREKIEWGDNWVTYQTPIFCAFKSNDEQTFGVVILVNEQKEGSSASWMYKMIDENCGPCEDRCPQKILKMLDPTDNETALGWREKCWRNLGKEMPEENRVSSSPKM